MIDSAQRARFLRLLDLDLATVETRGRWDPSLWGSNWWEVEQAWYRDGMIGYSLGELVA